MPTPRAGAPRGPRGAQGSPARNIEPESGRCAPLKIFMSVLLPAPFSPIKARTSPASTPSETPSSARVAPNDLETSRISRSTGASLPAASRPRCQHPGPVEGPQHAEGTRFVGAEDPVDLSPL